MKAGSDDDLIEVGVKAADTNIFQQNKIWARYTNEKADIAEVLMRVIRKLAKATDADRPLRALSIGSSDEPQFRILEATFKGGLYLLDVDPKALDIVNERIVRQMIKRVSTVQGDFTQDFADDNTSRRTLAEQLGGQPFELITLYHSLYYCEMKQWKPLVDSLIQSILAAQGAVHIVVMSATEQREGTTTWLYNHFAGKFFGHHNDQNLFRLKDELDDSSVLMDAQLSIEPREVTFHTDDFEKFMSVVWMIMLHPYVHVYSLDQRREVTTYVLKNLWRVGRPLIQVQDNLVITRGLDPAA